VGFERQTVTVEEAARILGIGRASAFEAIHRGEIPHLRIGRRILIPLVALQRLLEGDGERQYGSSARTAPAEGDDVGPSA